MNLKIFKVSMMKKRKSENMNQIPKEWIAKKVTY